MLISIVVDQNSFVFGHPGSGSVIFLGVCPQLPVKGVEKGLTDGMTEKAGVGRAMV